MGFCFVVPFGTSFCESGNVYNWVFHLSMARFVDVERDVDGNAMRLVRLLGDDLILPQCQILGFELLSCLQGQAFRFHHTPFSTQEMVMETNAL